MRRPFLNVEKVFPLMLALGKDVPRLQKETKIPKSSLHRILNGQSSPLMPMHQVLAALGVTDAEQIGKLILFREIKITRKVSSERGV